jgi:hypothetical protein
LNEAREKTEKIIDSLYAKSKKKEKNQELIEEEREKIT